MRRSNEPVFWSLFSGGGVVAALVAPVLIVITAFLVPWSHVSYERLHAIVTNPFGRIVIFLIVFLILFHFAHRFRHTLTEIGLKPYAMPIAVLCYLSAVAGTVIAGIVVFS